MKMLRSFGRSFVVIALVASGLLVAKTGTASATTTTCNGGTIAAGNYGSLVVNGFCTLPDSGTVNVGQSLTVTSSGFLEAAKLSTLIVSGNLFVKRGGVLVLGCSEEIGCKGASHHLIGQSLRADNALAVILHNNTIRGNVVLNGGGGGVTCTPNPVLGGPAYFDVEDNSIGQSVTITNVQSCWLGVIRNTVRGNVMVSSNTLADPDANEIVSNAIAMSLTCNGNSPAAQAGDSGGSPNTVGGNKNGECAAL
jgi:hypothetical protein